MPISEKLIGCNVIITSDKFIDFSLDSSIIVYDKLKYAVGTVTAIDQDELRIEYFSESSYCDHIWIREQYLMITNEKLSLYTDIMTEYNRKVDDGSFEFNELF